LARIRQRLRPPTRGSKSATVKALDRGGAQPNVNYFTFEDANQSYGACKPAGNSPMRDTEQLITEIEMAFRTKSSHIELRASARAPIERLETEALRE
jgi:hypothetical protein